MRTKLACKNPIGHRCSTKLFHANLSSAKRLAASHSNPMSNSFIFIMEIHVVCCLPLSFFVSRGVIWKTKEMTNTRWSHTAGNTKRSCRYTWFIYQTLDQLKLIRTNIRIWNSKAQNASFCYVSVTFYFWRQKNPK